MAFAARVFQVLIASPSDVEEEREIAVRTIQEWNDLNAAQRQLVLLPLRWETHAAPVYGKRPQDVINVQVVDHCDILVAIFWTRIGTPTGNYESGSLEEIERVASKGKPVMLYFSQAKQHPDEIDLDQLNKVREFKRKTFPNALVETYSSPLEFRDKLAKQLEIQLRTLIAEVVSEDVSQPEVRPVTDITLAFANAETRQSIGASMEVSTTKLVVNDFDQLPDYVEKDTATAKENIGGSLAASFLTWTVGAAVNKNYYRDGALHLIQRNLFRPVRFWLKNVGGIGARDVYIELTFRADSPNLLLFPLSAMPSQPPTPKQQTLLTGWHSYASNPEELLQPARDIWTSNMQVPALQPQREISPTPTIVVGARESCAVAVDARIFADTLPRPLHRHLELRIEVIEKGVNAEALVQALRPPPEGDRTAIQSGP